VTKQHPILDVVIPVDLREILRIVADDPHVDWHGIHGAAHWGRVLENGLHLAEHTGADRSVVALFAVFHDSRRVNDDRDLHHGYRGAELAKSLRHSHVFLADAEFELLYDACLRHTDGLTQADVTVQTCWDADRLDLGRVGIWPHPRKLCTDAARSPEMIDWALKRSQAGFVPPFVSGHWEPSIRSADRRSPH